MAGAEPAPFVGPREEKIKNSRAPVASVLRCSSSHERPPPPEEPPVPCVLCEHPQAQPHHTHRVLIASISAFCPNLGHFRGASHSRTGTGDFFRVLCAPSPIAARSPDPTESLCHWGKRGAG